MTFADEHARERIRADLDTTLVVEAAAGTGKTTELVKRIISLLARGRTTVDRIVAVTFTDKAAGELKLRLRAELEKARATAGNDEGRRKNLEDALAHLEEAQAGTIHSFCGDLLRERPVEAGIDPQFEPLDETSAGQQYKAVFRRWIEGVLENPPDGVRRSLRRLSHEDQPMARLGRAGWTLCMWRDFVAPWKRPQIDLMAEIDTRVEQLHRFAALSANATDKEHVVYKQTRAGRDLSDYIANIEKSRKRDYDGLEARLVQLARDRNFKIERVGSPKYGPGVDRQAVVAAHEVLVASLRQFAAKADADLVALLSNELRDSLAAYEEFKQRAGTLDFTDLLVRARDLLRDNEHVRRDMQSRYTHILVDEFQDTEPLQAELLMLLASSDPRISDWRNIQVIPGKLFIVGDPKQAIYRFRRADVGLYFDMKDRLERAGAVTVQLTTSFRSVPLIQNFVNSAFEARMTGDRATLQAEYVPLSPSRPQPPNQPSVVALSIPAPYGKKNLSATAVDESLPDAVGAFVDWVLTKSNWTVTERGRDDERFPVKARHICLMFRQFNSLFKGDLTRRYAEAFHARGIAHVLVGGSSFHEQEEVGTMRSALAAIEWPDDTLSVYATLRGSLFAISDADLFAYRTEFGYWHPFRIPETVPDSSQHVKRALEILRELSRRRNFVPIAETIHRLLTATRAHAGFVMRSGGEQILANVLHVSELARQYEARGAVSFRGFVENLVQAAEDGKQPQATIYEDGSEGVRMMTVHRAKGLEFPIVILADVTCKSARDEPDRHIDADRGLCAVNLAGWVPQDVIDHADEEHGRDVAEGVRIAYVAATRARDVLVVPAIGDDSTGHGPGMADHWWVAPLYSALYPTEQRRHRPTRATMCPEFGMDSVLKRPDGDLPDETSVRPGSHELRAAPNAYSVVWWDPRTLELGKAPSFSIRQQELLEKTNDDIVKKHLIEYRQWSAARAETLDGGAVPTIRFETATTRSKTEIPFTVDVEVIALAKEGRPFGPRFGALIHGILASVPLDGEEPQVTSAAKLQGRILGAKEEEISAAVAVVTTALKHPLLQRAVTAAEKGDCYRELPLTLRVQEDEMLVEGVADLVFCEGSRWIVVDFKTDQELANGLEHYRRQVSIYAKAIGESRNAETTAFLLSL
jgi:ATP-dependent helicase/nuclease subunit A